MKLSRRTWIILGVGLCLLLAIVFRDFLLKYLAMPFALVLWVFWRLLQSVDQALYWVFLGVFALLAGLVRLSRLMEKELTVLGPSPQPRTSAVLERIEYWRGSIRLGCPRTTGPYTVEHHMGEMLAELYTSQQPDAVYFEVYNALKDHRLPVPEPVGSFMFPSEQAASRHALKETLRAMWDFPRRRLYQWTGREVADYYRLLDQALSFMESSLERKQ